MAIFNLAVVRPVKGQAGELIMTRTTHADSITDAVKRVRGEFEGTGYVVMQEQAFQPKAQSFGPVGEALLTAYQRSIAGTKSLVANATAA